MIGKLNKGNTHFTLVLILTILSLLLQKSLNGFVFLILGMLVWSVIFFQTRNGSNSLNALVKMVMLSVPLSFTSVINGSYGNLPISWFNIFIVILVIVVVTNKIRDNRLDSDHLSIAALYMIYISLFPLLASSSFFDGLKQYASIFIFLLAALLGSSIQLYVSTEEKEGLLDSYLQGIYIAAIGLLVQFISVNYANMEVGTFVTFGMNRNAYAFLFSDFSFLSLYLASGAMVTFIRGYKHYRSVFSWFFLMAFLLVLSMVTSARTGIVAFILAFAFYSVEKLLFLLYRGSVKSMLLVVFNVTVLGASYLILNEVRAGGITGDSGRLTLNKIAFDVFNKNPFLGVGFGTTYYSTHIGTLPHNIIFQYLAQGGLVFTIPLIIILLLLGNIARKSSRELFWGFITILIGALFIPDILNSRYLAATALLISMKNRNIR